jgi:preprotein translocase subunit SecD
MLNRYPLWKYVLIIAIVVPGLLYSLPNLFGEDPGVHISGTRAFRVDTDTLRQMEQALRAANIPIAASTLDEGGARLRFQDTTDQLRARDVIQRELGDRYSVALTLLPAMPGWFERINAYPMYLGLDLRGGVHFLMEVDMEAAVRRAEDRYVDELRVALRDERIRYLGIRRGDDGVVELRFRDDDDRARARRLIDAEYRGELTLEEGSVGGAQVLLARLTDTQVNDINSFALDQNVTALRNRVNELGVAEPIVQRQGDSRIVVQLPGIQDTARAKQILGRTATLEIMMVDEGGRRRRGPRR